MSIRRADQTEAFEVSNSDDLSIVRWPMQTSRKKPASQPLPLGLSGACSLGSGAEIAPVYRATSAVESIITRHIDEFSIGTWARQG